MLGLVGANLMVYGILGLRALEVYLYVHDFGFGPVAGTVLAISANR